MSKRKHKAEARAKAKVVTKPIRFSFSQRLTKLNEPILLKNDDDGRAVWAKPSNLHDKIICFVWRRQFDEWLAKWRHQGMSS